MTFNPPPDIIYQHAGIKCLVACHNSNGEPDLVTVSVDCSAQDLSDGHHYQMAREKVEEMGYEATSWVADETDPGYRKYPPITDRQILAVEALLHTWEVPDSPEAMCACMGDLETAFAEFIDMRKTSE